MKQILLAFLLLIIVMAGTFATSPGLAGVKKTSLTLSIISPQNANIILGNTLSLSLSSFGIKWDPDGHISYITLSNGTRRYFIAGNQKTYTIDTKTSTSLADALDKNPVIKQNFGPDPSVSYRNNYSTISSVLQTQNSNPSHIFAFTQNEEQVKLPNGTYDYSNFTASVGLLESYNGGVTWKDYGPVIRGDDYLPPGTRITGAGEPCAIINNGYVYIYFVDWSSRTNVQHPDQIYLARTKIFPDGGLGAFEFYTYGGFSNQEANLQPVISADDNPNDKYTSLPSVSFNKSLNAYLMVYQTDIGFYSAVSQDGLNWTNQKLIFMFPKPLSQRQFGDIWYSYPTLLSDTSQKNDQSTQNTGNLYFATGIWPDTAHQLTAEPFEIK